MRCLDIGPGRHPVPGFETLDAAPGPNVTHVGDARRPPFADDTFELVHSSHTIEHIQWYEAEAALREWARIVKPGGALEVWTVNAYALMRELVALEQTDEWEGPGIGSWKENLTQRDPYKWAVGRMLNYPKDGKHGHLWQHRSIWTPKYLRRVMTEIGLTMVHQMDRTEVRGKDHGWINFGFRGVKS